jgi:Flp pilus assembly protein TadB
MKKAIIFALCILFNFSAFAVNTSHETVVAQQKLESIVNGTYKAKNAKEAKALDKFKSKFQKLVKKVKDGKKVSAGDLGSLFVTIGIILIIVGLVAIVLGVLGIGVGYISGGGALVLGLIFYLIGKFAF